MTRTTKIWLFIAGGAVVLTGLCCSGAFLFFMNAAEGPENIAIAVDYPVTAETQESFVIKVSVTNEATNSQELNSIDVNDAYGDGIQITASRPPWAESTSMLGFTSYYFETPIAPGATQTVEFDARAVRTGDFSGDLDVCINNEFTFITQVMRTIVSAADDG